MPIKNTTIPIKFNSRFEHSGIELDDVNIGSLTTIPLSLLKNYKVQLNDKDIIWNGIGLYSDPDSAYNTMYAKSLDEGIARWYEDPNKRIIIYPNELGKLLAARIVSNPPEKPLLISKPKTTKQSETLKTVESKPALVNKPIPIPEDAKQGLVKVVNGLPYYEFQGDLDKIVLLIESYIKTHLQPNVVYQDTSKEGINNIPNGQDDPESINTGSLPINKSEYLDDLLFQDDPELYVKYRNRKYGPTVKVKKGDEGAYLYRYPHKIVHTYKVSPEVAKYVNENLNNDSLYTDSYIGNMYSDIPLYNLPNGELNDTVFHDVFTILDGSEWSDYFEGPIVHHQFRQGAVNSVMSGYHTDDGLSAILFWDASKHVDVPILGNKVFKPLEYYLDGSLKRYSMYYIPSTNHAFSKEYREQLDKELYPSDFATDIYGNKHWLGLPDTDYEYVPGPLEDNLLIRSHLATKDSLKQAELQRQSNDSSVKSSWWNRLIGRNKKVEL